MAWTSKDRYENFFRLKNASALTAIFRAAASRCAHWYLSGHVVDHVHGELGQVSTKATSRTRCGTWPSPMASCWCAMSPKMSSICIRSRTAAISGQAMRSPTGRRILRSTMAGFMSAPDRRCTGGSCRHPRHPPRLPCRRSHRRPLLRSQNRWNLVRRRIDRLRSVSARRRRQQPGRLDLQLQCEPAKPACAEQRQVLRADVERHARIRAVLAGRIVSGEARAHPALAELTTPRSPPSRYPPCRCCRRTPSA